MVKTLLQHPDHDAARTAYERFAPYYDAYTAHDHYPVWLTAIADLAAAHGARGGRLLDLGCGTGSSLEPMHARGWDVTGCDISPAMLELARLRVPAARLVCADMRDLGDLGRFELVWALNDPINYLTDLGDVRAVLRWAAASLAPGGVLVFDANTRLGYRTGFVGSAARERDGVRLRWDGEEIADALYRAELAVVVADDAPVPGKPPSVHVQRCHRIGDLLGALAGAGLVCEQVAGQLPDGSLEPSLDEDRHLRAIFFATALPVPRDSEGR